MLHESVLLLGLFITSSLQIIEELRTDRAQTKGPIGQEENYLLSWRHTKEPGTKEPSAKCSFRMKQMSFPFGRKKLSTQIRIDNSSSSRHSSYKQVLEKLTSTVFRTRTHMGQIILCFFKKIHFKGFHFHNLRS